MNAFMDALSRNWDLIITVSLWAVSLLLGVVLIAKVFKALQMEFEFEDFIPSVLAVLWFGILLVMGPGNVSAFLSGLL